MGSVILVEHYEVNWLRKYGQPVMFLAYLTMSPDSMADRYASQGGPLPPYLSFSWVAFGGTSHKHYFAMLMLGVDV
jgi:hypothetical protein